MSDFVQSESDLSFAVCSKILDCHTDCRICVEMGPSEWTVAVLGSAFVTCAETKNKLSEKGHNSGIEVG